MCIRDSARTGRGDDAQRLQRVVVIIKRVEEELDHAAVARCLLYTSDAADERSSVDLGGRRIIKKKISVHSRTVTPIINHIVT